MGDRWFSHSGDIGDVIYCLPTIRKAGGGTLYLYHRPGKTAHGMTQAKADSIRSLLILQPYITDVIYLDHERDHNLNGFRDHGRNWPDNLADMHLGTHGFKPEARHARWLDVDFKVTDFPVVFHRSPRYHNPKFPWRRVADTYRDRAVFVGSVQEHASFTKDFGPIRHVPTANLLELARIIAGCKLFVGNQSSPAAISHGLKHTMILEVYPPADNCRFKRVGCLYATDDSIELPNPDDL